MEEEVFDLSISFELDLFVGEEGLSRFFDLILED